MNMSVTFSGRDGDRRELAVEDNTLVLYHCMGDLKIEKWRNTFSSMYAATKEYYKTIKFI